MNAQPLAAFALCLAPFTNASAAQSSYQAEALIVSGETSTTLSVPLPDESKGQLAGMQVDMIIEANGVLGIENLDKNATEALMFGVFGANIESMGGDPMVGQDGQFVRNARLDAFDGLTDYLGSSGRTMSFVSQSQHNSVKLDAAMAQKIVASSAGERELSFRANGNSSIGILGPQSYLSADRVQIVVMLQVTYFYEEPGAQDSPENKLGAVLDQPAAMPACLQRESRLLLGEPRTALAVC